MRCLSKGIFNDFDDLTLNLFCISVFVETLDKCFENVCELDLIFHSEKVHAILDEIVMGGMVLETSMESILKSVADITRLEKATPVPIKR